MRPFSCRHLVGLFSLLVLMLLFFIFQISFAKPSATCTVPTQETIRGKLVEFDQCYVHEFSHDGSDYVIRTYYTEDPTHQNEVNGIEQCDADEAAVDRCEHALADVDNGAGDNVYAVSVAEQAELGIKFYVDNTLPILDGGTEMTIYIAEDPKNGFVIGTNTTYHDDDSMETTDVLGRRWNVLHEMQHLIQKVVTPSGVWNLWYTEGVARAVEDRIDAALDAAEKAFITDTRRMLKDYDDERSNDILAAKYRAALWWTWLFDQYADPADSEPNIGWGAINDFYDEIEAEDNHSLDATIDFINGQGGDWEDDFIDYTLAMYAFKYNPTNPRLDFRDAELDIFTNGLENHTIIDTSPGYATYLRLVKARSSQYTEYVPASQCDYIGFGFANNAGGLAYSVMTVDSGGDLQDVWTSRSPEWARTVHSDGLSRVVGVVTGLDDNKVLVLEHGCVEPDIEIKSPTTGAFAFVGEADNPRQFLVRLAVTGENGSGVAGLMASDFSVVLQKSGEPAIPATIVNAMYVQDNYWLLVQAPSDADGAQTGQFYDLTVTLHNDSDTQPNSVLYVERTVDKLIVLDRSGSMGNDGRLDAASNAATLMTYELSPSDQGAFVRYSDDAQLVVGLDGMDSTQRATMSLNINITTANGNTSIGDGLLEAAVEHDANGISDNACVIVLLSDGYENSDLFWDDVADDVSDNECFMDVVGFGPSANEALLQQIAASSLGGGHYDYAPVNGSVPINNNGVSPFGVGTMMLPTANLSWQNYLSRVYDAKAIRAAGRQRIFSGVGDNSLNDVETFSFDVDPTSDELVVSIAWQQPMVDGIISLTDPDGNPLDPNVYQTTADTHTARVWRVPGPLPGKWTLVVQGISQQYHVSASAKTLLELYLFAGTPQHSAEQGVHVPILATLGGQGDPVLGATVHAVVTNPLGQQKLVTLYDDGAHGDMEAADGVYGNWYTQTTGGETAVADPHTVIEGDEPQSVGSYLVEAVATWDGLRREAQTSFFLNEGKDSDGDGYPNAWETQHGMDPETPDDPSSDADGDGLPLRCEWNLGTDPLNPDTDGGGESDGSEVPACEITDQDPLDPGDDRVGPIRAFLAEQQLTPDGTPYFELSLAGLPLQPIRSVDLYRRTGPNEAWQLILEDVAPAPSGSHHITDVIVGPLPQVQYRVVPLLAADGGGTAVGQVLETAVLPVSSDPYAPEGSIVIAEGATTASSAVTLLIAAEDSGHGHGDEAHDAPAGTPTRLLEMRISTDPLFGDAKWRPFATQVDNFPLGSPNHGDVVTVYIEFQDEAGNIGSDGVWQSATVQYLGPDLGQSSTTLFLPLIRR